MMKHMKMSIATNYKGLGHECAIGGCFCRATGRMLVVGCHSTDTRVVADCDVARDDPARGAQAESPALRALRDERFKIRNDIRHCGSLSRILVPHPLHEIDGLGTPVFTKTGNCRSSVLRAHRVVDVMLITPLPRIFLGAP